ncbi:MAG TPA: 1-deoxy-D-xylulose-5-phosphate synthase, partial [Pseudonocardiaceae bacterium]|nr:1-deoxy-D-xylulose-5-phosphate synthase [Pseudonocardiaceae bacterium]
MVQLAAEIRTFLVEKVSRTGGHLGPNLGAVELTIAVHRVFDSPHDPVVFDTGHQAYVHKILTGRAEGFDRLRKRGGLSGYPSRAESEHDWVESSHASAALSYADGLAKAFAWADGTAGDPPAARRHVVAVVGDGALTGGMCWEALNNIAAGKDRPVVIVVNDNGRSYSPTIGGLADHLSTLRLRPGYERVLRSGKQALQRTPVVGRALYAALHATKRGLKDALTPQILFEDLGLKYLGPVDGHDLRAMETALRRAKDFGGPVIVHAVTRKGNGYRPAENDAAELMHQVKVMDPETGEPIAPAGVSWTSVFTEELIRLGSERDDLVALTAAMPGPTGLAAFRERFPDRCFDVGIAEQHALTSAAGMALGGLHPVVSLYSTFLNRGFDQLLMDVALLNAPVTVTLDRAGVTGDDGASHNGMWDLSVLGIVPGIRVAAPRDAATLREELAEAVAVTDGPTAVRFPKGAVIESVPALERVEEVDVLARPDPGCDDDVLLVGVGAFAALAVAAAARLADQGIGVTVVDPRWVLP